MDIKLENLLSALIGIVSVFITQWLKDHSKKSEQLLSAPKLLIIPLKDTKALVNNIGKINSYNKIFQINFNITKSVDDVRNDISSSIQFTSLSKETLVKDYFIQNSIFLGIQCRNEKEEGLSLYRIIDKNKKSHDIDSSIVLRTLESGDSFGFICNEKDAPSSIEGSFGEQSGRYDIKHFLGSKLHFKKYITSKNK